jgi:hypothetical protein
MAALLALGLVATALGGMQATADVMATLKRPSACGQTRESAAAEPGLRGGQGMSDKRWEEISEYAEGMRRRTTSPAWAWTPRSIPTPCPSSNASSTTAWPIRQLLSGHS